MVPHSSKSLLACGSAEHSNCLSYVVPHVVYSIVDGRKEDISMKREEGRQHGAASLFVKFVEAVKVMYTLFL